MKGENFHSHGWEHIRLPFYFTYDNFEAEIWSLFMKFSRKGFLKFQKIYIYMSVRGYLGHTLGLKIFK